MRPDPTRLTRDAGRHIHHFHGGLRLRHNKKAACSRPVERPPLPAELIVPMRQQHGSEAVPLVKAGTAVLKGELIGADDRGGPGRVHAPTSGTVRSVRMGRIAHPTGQRGVCIHIEPDGQDLWTELRPEPDWRSLPPEEIVTRIRDAGIVGLGGAVFPTGPKSEHGRARQVHTLVINGAECEPYIACDEMLMRERPGDIISGALILQVACGAERIIIAVEDQMGAVSRALESAILESGENIDLVRIPSIYPEGGERQLIEVLTGQQVPDGGLPADIGLACQNVATAAAVHQAIVLGRPLIERVVTVTGNGIPEPGNLLALFGTPIRHLVDQCGGFTDDAVRLVIGGPMMGYAIESDGEPVIKASNCILALTVEDLRPPQDQMPCIRCGECARVCPATLMPQMLHWEISNGLWDQVQSSRLSACIECGCCDFVCPSQIPLVEWFRFGKGELQRLALEKTSADHARARFEAREQRLERDRHEKRERIAQRKQALRDRSEQQKKVAAAIERAGARKTQEREDR